MSANKVPEVARGAEFAGSERTRLPPDQLDSIAAVAHAHIVMQRMKLCTAMYTTCSFPTAAPTLTAGGPQKSDDEVVA